MESVSASPRKSLFEIEKEVFPDSIHIVNTYYNKRKSFSKPHKRDRSSLSLGGEYSPLTKMDRNKRSTLIVENWMKSYSKDMDQTRRERTPFADLDPNRMCLKSEKNGSVSKMSLRSSAPDNRTDENCLSKQQSLKFKSPASQKLTELKRIQNKSTHILKINEKVKLDFEEKMDIEEDDRSNTSRADSTIVIEDSQETYVDKDRLACLEVLRAEERLQLDRLHEEGDVRFEPSDATVINVLKKNIERLTSEISRLEARRAPAFRKGNTIILSLRALLNHSIDIPIETYAKDFNASLKLENCKKIINAKRKNKGVAKKKVQITGKVKKYIRGNKIIYVVKDKLCSNPKKDISVQTDLSCRTCQHNSIIENIPTGNSSKPRPINEQEDEIVEVYGSDEENATVTRMFGNGLAGSTHSGKTESQVEKDTYNGTVEGEVGLSDTDEKAHNSSGYHSVKVHVHASMGSLHGDSDNEVIEATPEVVIDRGLSETNGSNFYWEERHRTPPRVVPPSPTYTNIGSSGSSNKENRDPNTTPLQTKKEDNKKEEEHKSSARRPLSLLFEALPAVVRVACSCLSPVQESLVMLLCKRLGWTYCTEYSPEITHLVVGVDEDNKAQRTVKYVCAVAAGSWVVSYKWAEQSLRQECHIEEELFEVLDWSGESGPQLSRTAHIKLFSTLTFCCLPSVTTVQRDILGWVLEAAGARVVQPSELEVAATGPTVVLHEPKEAETPLCYKELESQWQVATVILNYEWVLESLGRYRLLCPDIFLLSLGEEQRSPVWLYNLCSDTPLSQYSD